MGNKSERKRRRLSVKAFRKRQSLRAVLAKTQKARERLIATTGTCEPSMRNDVNNTCEQSHSNAELCNLFPRDEHMHQKWMNIVRKQRSEDDWKPSNSSTVCSEHFESDMKYTTPKGCLRLKKSAAPVTKLKAPMTQPGATGNNSYEPTSCSDQESLDSNAGLEDPLATEPSNTTPQCRFCAEYSKDCFEVTDKDRPYFTRHKTALTLNDLSVEVDFNDDALPKTVCLACDSKLLVMFDFLKQVKEAQDSLINVRDYVKEDIGNLTVKTECESPTPEDNDDDIIDSKDGIVDSLTVSETVFIKPITSKHKRKSVEDTPKTQKKPKVIKNVEIESEESELITDIKEETAEVAAYEAENFECVDTETVPETSELELATRALLNEISENGMVRSINK